ncbi:MAG TPA: sulfatase-like hydrolase/transferase [Nocardioidaceae bacterium]|nr:sulfatase-like hydrolase/transferase [Nocardioidaceae bacterium]
MLHAQKRTLRVLLALVLASLVAATLQLTNPASVATARDKPNILLITTDDQSVNDLKYMPNTRRLLGADGAGATFKDMVSSYPLCCPARATILTGQLSHNHDIRTNKEPHGGWAKLRNQPDVVSATIGNWLQNVGYHTMFTGKFLNGYGGPNDLGKPAGWNKFYATTGGTYDYFDFRVNEDGTVRQFTDDYQTDRFGTYTRQHIAEANAQDRPFFIWESNLAPHDACTPRPNARCKWGPATPPDEDADDFATLPLHTRKDPSFNERVVTEKPANVRALRRWHPVGVSRTTRKNRMRVRSLQAVDRSVQQTVTQLETLGELDNTLIIFTSDNGYMLGQHRWQGKILPYEPSLRVPLLMRWTAGGITPGTTVPQTTALVDLPSTIAAAAGATPLILPQDGRSLLPLARGAEDAEGYGAMSIESGQNGWETSDRRWFYRGVRTRRYTYLEYPRNGERELYDRLKDPSQLNNVAYRPAYRLTRTALAAKLRQLKSCQGAACLDVEGGAPAPRPQRYLTRGWTVHPDELGSIGVARQVVTVTASTWSAGAGMATAWQREGRTWTIKRGPFPVTLGAQGMIEAASRRDGTGETPAGTFRPELALGNLRNPGTPIPYRRIDRDDYWSMDRRVPKTYNVYQQSRPPKAQWRTSAAVHWWSKRGRYPHALVLGFNLPTGLHYSQARGQWQANNPADVRKGSLVLHAGGRVPARGWASMKTGDIAWLLRWLRPDQMHSRFVIGTPGYLRGRL